MHTTNTKNNTRIPKLARDLIQLSQPQREAAVKAWVTYLIKEVPVGKTDNAKRWHPSSIERRSCCDRIREPSRSWPWSLYKHCLSLEHKEHLYRAEHAHVLVVKRWFADKGFDAMTDHIRDTHALSMLMEQELLLIEIPEAADESAHVARKRM